MQQAKVIAEDLREHVKALGFNRHKLVVQVLTRSPQLHFLWMSSIDVSMPLVQLLYNWSCREADRQVGQEVLLR